ncbi:D-alanyl-D-alanine carboxypeptidase [Luteolibacter yonseiensis]|uniref:D-alanyl-D-alanine carboxypeptidase n=1 Tax=Luteolibacter yonseiensis TaxID=1144680 RepID=A0A934R8S3_9BACT|nr:D-alanyl-D-alanine carboxypeptidase family protein [Luteolibacter yonseiensis]MBK1817159.1 D-alanyl-D-alanine carboxypeptidase [Luteolibacter yonseiensis]
MSRLSCVHLAALAFTAALISSCGGNPPPPISRAGQNLPSEQKPGAPVHVAAIPQTPPPPIAAESAIVIDVASGRVLYAKNADSPRAVASTQKIITALCVLDAGDIDKPVTIQPSDTACEPTKLNLKSGDVYTRRELTKALMVKSANDVARSLARDVGGSQEGFSDLMNQKAASLGMRNSHFINPNGLPQAGQYSTARDMAIAARAAYRSPLIRSFTATKSMTFRFNDGRTRELENTNKLLKTVPYCDGLKTGTTNAAGRCLVASGSLNGRSVITVVLKSNTPNIWKDSSKLLAWALERPASGS